MKFSQWNIEKIYDAVDGRAQIEGGTFDAFLNPQHYSVVKASASVEFGEPKKLYKFSYELELEEGVKCQLVYTWRGKDGAILFRSHAVCEETIISPENAASLDLNVCFFGFSGGHGRIGNVNIDYIGPYQSKIIRLAAIMVPSDRLTTIENNIRVSAERIDAAVAEGADLVLLTETYNVRGVDGVGSFDSAATMDDPAITMLQKKASQHKIYVAASVRMKDEYDLVHNSLLLYNRAGELIGRYTKAHLTMGEITGGNVPGREICSFDTELGRIGCSICWDRFMPEHARVLFMQQVDIVLNPTASGKYPLTEAHNGYANAAFIVTAHTTHDPSLTRITNRRGEILATADPQKGFAIAEVDVNAYEPVYWLSAPDADTDPRSVYRNERRPDLYEILLKQ